MLLLADRQDLTRLGIAYLIERHYPQAAWQYVEDKVSLLQHMGLCDGDAVVVIDFNLSVHLPKQSFILSAHDFLLSACPSVVDRSRGFITFS